MKVERRFGGALISESSLLLSSERWLISRRSFFMVLLELRRSKQGIFSNFF
jgi:hypothetical protein